MLIVWKIWRASLSYYLRFEIRPVALLPTNVRIRFENIVSEQVCEISKKLLIKNTKIKTVCILIKIIIFKVYDESLIIIREICSKFTVKSYLKIVKFFLISFIAYLEKAPLIVLKAFTIDINNNFVD